MVSENFRTEPIVQKSEWRTIYNSTPSLQNGRAKFRFLYIGSHVATEEVLLNQFEAGDMAYDFGDAKRMLTKPSLSAGCLYDVIFIDYPLERRELRKFFSFLRRNRFSELVVVYNGTRLTDNCIKCIRRFSMVDDVFDIQSNHINYAAIIPFLRSSKRAHKLKRLRTLKKTARRLSVRRCVSFGVKRLLDIMFAIIVLILLLPFLLIIAMVIKLESKGPILYTSTRAGKGYKIFKFYKFRTMVLNADREINALAHLNQYNGDNANSPVFYKIKNDPRVTRFGKFLRNTSLDEIPQLFNVLKGDMSLVGNRPLPLYEAASLTTNECVERFTATAGITGLWQVKKRGKAEMSVDERINLDITYARNENVIYDLWIMLCTPLALMQKSDV
jgi:lipopolysaccharide/colanic/teichoic acid biosynthesis glycosyltransferase